jgi:hypothetical protein
VVLCPSFVGFRAQQELQPEITNKIRLIAPAGFEAASGHEEKNHRAMDFVATAKLKRGLVLGGMKSTLAVDLHVQFEFFRELVADDEPCEPGVGSLVNKLITEFIIHIDGAKLPGEFEGQEERLARGRDSAADGVVRVVEEELRKD